jgi:hypothetical protein
VINYESVQHLQAIIDEALAEVAKTTVVEGARLK